VMEEFWKTSTTPPPPSTPTEGLGERPEPSTAEAKETEPFALAASQITELMQRFVEEVRVARDDVRVAADSARTANADAERIRQEALKLRADAQADAIRVTEDARAEADRIVARCANGPRSDALCQSRTSAALTRLPHADEHRPKRPVLLAADQETRRRFGS
jgi:hypothetical protein